MFHLVYSHIYIYILHLRICIYFLQGSNVYIKNISDKVDDDTLRERFDEFGNITSVKIMRDDKGISKGFGFVCYATPDEANCAVGTMRGNPLLFFTNSYSLQFIDKCHFGH
jgi:RNA recognition motif-containing protein